MPDGAHSGRVFEFDCFELDPAAGELRRDGEPIRIRPKPLALLLYLARHAGRFVSNQELLDTVWSEVAVSETALTTAVKAVRRALGDDGDVQELIETRRSRGYRLVPVVRMRAPRPSAPAPADELLGRDAARATLDDALDAALGGAGRLLFVRGEAGIGKSRLLLEAQRILSSRGVPHAEAWCSEADAGPAYGPWIQLLRALAHADPAVAKAARESVEIGWLMPELRPPDAEARETREPPDAADRLRLLDGVSELLRRAAEPAGLGLLLDDLHAADQASLRLLVHLVHTLPSARILVVVAVREPAMPAAKTWTQVSADLARLSSTVMLPLSGLDDAAAAELARRVASEPLDEASLAAIVSGARGNPFFLRELARAGPGAPALGARDALHARLERLTAESRRALEAGAVVGRAFEPDLVAAALGRDRSEVVEALAEAERDGLIHTRSGVRMFDHDLVREAVLARLDHDGLAELHLRVGRALEELSPDDAERLARHFASSQLRTTTRAAEYSLRAAARSLKRRAYGNAVSHFERALAALSVEDAPDPALRVKLLRRLGVARHLAGEPLPEIESAFREAIELARDCGDGHAFARTALGLAHIPVSGVDVRSILEEALRLAHPEDEVTVGLLARLATEEAILGQIERAEAHSAHAIALAEQRGEAAALCTARIARLIVMNGRTPPSEQIALADSATEAAERAGRPDQASIARWRRFFSRLELGDPDAAQDCESFARWILEQRLVRARPNLLRQRAALAFLAGDLAGAERSLEEAFELARREQNPITLRFIQTAQTLCVRERWDLPGLRRRLNEQPAPRPDRPIVVASVADCLARLGRPEEARAALRDLDPDAVDRSSALGGRPVVACWLAETCAEVRDLELAETLHAWTLSAQGPHVVGVWGGLCLGAVSRYTGILCAALGRSDEAERRLREAIEENERSGAWLFAGHARVDLARVLVQRDRDRHHAEASEQLGAAGDWARDRGLGLLEDRIETARLELAGVVRLRGRRPV